jgi:uncharacterized protein (UPF0333 family)
MKKSNKRVNKMFFMVLLGIVILTIGILGYFKLASSPQSNNFNIPDKDKFNQAIKKVYANDPEVYSYWLSNFKDNVAILSLQYRDTNTGNMSMAGGEGIWAHVNNEWIMINKAGDDIPPCNQYESLKVGKGLDCFDDKTSESRKAIY